VESIAQQTYALLMTILAGAVVGLLFDAYRVTRSLMTQRQLATAMTDLLYWIVVTPTVFAMLLAGNWGELRFYVLVGLTIGLVLYFQTLSSTFIWALMAALRGTGRMIGASVHVVVRVLTFPWRLLLALTQGFSGSAGRWGGARAKWGRVSPRPRRARLAMAWQRLSLARIFGRFGI